MNNNIVYVKKCKKYNNDLIKKTLAEIFSDMNGLKDLINKGDRVVIKPNLLLGKKPDEVVTTHPFLIGEVINYLKKFDCKIIIGDSPGGPFIEGRLKNIYKKCGYDKFDEIENVELNYNTNYRKVSFNDGHLVKSFEIVDFISDADVIINMPKLKTHSFMKYTGAVKNLFGVIPGMIKAEYHLRMPETDNFAMMLVDLANLVKPTINIMDAVIGMEGDGPSSGIKKEFGYIMVSTSCFSLDVAGTYLLNAKDVPTLYKAGEIGFPEKIEELILKGDKLKPVLDTKIPKIKKAETRNFKGLPNFLVNVINKLLKPRPLFNEDNCVKCGDCAKNCPSSAIKLDEYPKVDLNECIRCYCCQELCSYNAVKIKKPLLGKILFR